MYDSSMMATSLGYAQQLFSDLKFPIAILVGLGLLFLVGDFFLSRWLGPGGASEGMAGSGRFRRPGSGGKNLGRLPGWRGEDYHTTNSWGDLEDHARKVNGWTGDD